MYHAHKLVELLGQSESVGLEPRHGDAIDLSAAEDVCARVCVCARAGVFVCARMCVCMRVCVRMCVCCDGKGYSVLWPQTG